MTRLFKFSYLIGSLLVVGVGSSGAQEHLKLDQAPTYATERIQAILTNDRNPRVQASDIGDVLAWPFQALEGLAYNTLGQVVWDISAASWKIRQLESRIREQVEATAILRQYLSPSQIEENTRRSARLVAIHLKSVDDTSIAQAAKIVFQVFCDDLIESVIRQIVRDTDRSKGQQYWVLGKNAQAIRKQLRTITDRVTADFFICIQKSTDLNQVDTCVERFKISAPYRLANEILPVLMDSQLESTVPDSALRAKLVFIVKNNFDDCSLINYFHRLRPSGIARPLRASAEAVIRSCMIYAVPTLVKAMLEELFIRRLMPFGQKEHILRLNAHFAAQKAYLFFSEKGYYRDNMTLTTFNLHKFDMNFANRVGTEKFKADLLAWKDHVLTWASREVLRDFIRHNKKFQNLVHSGNDRHWILQVAMSGYDVCLARLDWLNPTDCLDVLIASVVSKSYVQILDNQFEQRLGKDRGKTAFQSIKNALKQCFQTEVNQIMTEAVAQNRASYAGGQNNTMFAGLPQSNSGGMTQLLNRSGKRLLPCIRESLSEAASIMAAPMAVEQIESHEMLASINFQLNEDDLELIRTIVRQCVLDESDKITDITSLSPELVESWQPICGMQTAKRLLTSPMVSRVFALAIKDKIGNEGVRKLQGELERIPQKLKEFIKKDQVTFQSIAEIGAYVESKLFDLLKPMIVEIARSELAQYLPFQSTTDQEVQDRLSQQGIVQDFSLRLIVDSQFWYQFRKSNGHRQTKMVSDTVKVLNGWVANNEQVWEQIKKEALGSNFDFLLRRSIKDKFQNIEIVSGFAKRVASGIVLQVVLDRVLELREFTEKRREQIVRFAFNQFEKEVHHISDGSIGRDQDLLYGPIWESIKVVFFVAGRVVFAERIVPLLNDNPELIRQLSFKLFGTSLIIDDFVLDTAVDSGLFFECAESAETSIDFNLRVTELSSCAAELEIDLKRELLFPIAIHRLGTDDPDLWRVISKEVRQLYNDFDAKAKSNSSQIDTLINDWIASVALVAAKYKLQMQLQEELGEAAIDSGMVESYEAAVRERLASLDRHVDPEEFKDVATVIVVDEVYSLVIRTLPTYLNQLKIILSPAQVDGIRDVTVECLNQFRNSFKPEELNTVQYRIQACRGESIEKVSQMVFLWIQEQLRSQGREDLIDPELEALAYAVVDIGLLVYPLLGSLRDRDVGFVELDKVQKRYKSHSLLPLIQLAMAILPRLLERYRAQRLVLGYELINFVDQLKEGFKRVLPSDRSFGELLKVIFYDGVTWIYTERLMQEGFVVGFEYFFEMAVRAKQFSGGLDMLKLPSVQTDWLKYLVSSTQVERFTRYHTQDRTLMDSRLLGAFRDEFSKRQERPLSLWSFPTLKEFRALIDQSKRLASTYYGNNERWQKCNSEFVGTEFVLKHFRESVFDSSNYMRILFSSKALKRLRLPAMNLILGFLDGDQPKFSLSGPFFDSVLGTLIRPLGNLDDLIDYALDIFIADKFSRIEDHESSFGEKLGALFSSRKRNIYFSRETPFLYSWLSIEDGPKREEFKSYLKEVVIKKLVQVPEERTRVSSSLNWVRDWPGKGVRQIKVVHSGSDMVFNRLDFGEVRVNGVMAKTFVVDHDRIGREIFHKSYFPRVRMSSGDQYILDFDVPVNISALRTNQMLVQPENTSSQLLIYYRTELGGEWKYWTSHQHVFSDYPQLSEVQSMKEKIFEDYLDLL